MNSGALIRLLPLARALAMGMAFHATAGLAQIQIGPGAGGATSTQHQLPADSNVWWVADLSDPSAPAPIRVIPGIYSGAWNQELTFDAAFPPLVKGDSWVLQELLQFGEGEFEVRQWSLDILTSGWRWGDPGRGGYYNLLDTATAEPVPGLAFGMSFTGQTLFFAFNPIPTGRDVLLVATLDYSGPDGAPPSPVLIQAVATVPEPGASALWTVGLVALLAQATHRRSRQPTRCASPVQR